jgi:hypothetical protein
MDAMRNARHWTGVVLIAVILGACVPEPSNRIPAGSDSTPTRTATPEPTPAGPTPTPSYVRPTPTPQPTFFSYTVVSGDSLGGIAKKFKTSARSIAYWNRAIYPSLDPESGSYRPDYLKVGWVLMVIPNAEVDPENLPTLPPGG